MEEYFSTPDIMRRMSPENHAKLFDKILVFVHGTGRRKTCLQKSMETLETYIDQLKDNVIKLKLLEERELRYIKEDYVGQ